MEGVIWNGGSTWDFTSDVDVLDNVKDIIVIDLPLPLGLQDIVHDAPDLTGLLQRFPASIIQEENMHINF